MAEATAREVDTLAGRPELRAAAADAGDHARGDPARGVRGPRRRAHGPVCASASRGWPRPRACSAGCRSWTATSGGLSPAARFRRALAAVDELIYAEIAERRESEPGEDVLSLLLSARHEDGSPMSDVELRDELMTLLTAGHETTATGLSWAFERLMRTPRVMERLIDSLDDDEYLDAVVKETLRVRPVIVDVARKLTRADGDRRLHAAGRHAGAARDRRRARAARPLPRARGVPARALHRRRSPSRTPGSRSAAACGAASARRSPRWRCGWCCARCCGASGCARPRTARAPARPARDRGARARRARGGDRADGAPAEPALAAARSPSAYCARHLGTRRRRGRLGRRAAGCSPGRRRPARALPDLVQLALRVPEAHRRDQQQQDEDHGTARRPLEAHRLLGALDPAAGGPLGDDRRDDDERAQRYG